MGILDRLLGSSPFRLLVEHTKKVHGCVLLLRPIAEALIAEDHERLNELHHEMSRTEHQADVIKNEIRDHLSTVHLLSVSKPELVQFLAVQDGVADAAEDFSVVVLLRKTRLNAELRDDFLAFVDQVMSVSEQLLALSEELATLAESAFTGKEAHRVLDAIDKIGQEEWRADKLQRAFARHYYALEKQIDPITLMFYDKFCWTLSAVANNAEKTAKFLRLIIARKE